MRELTSETAVNEDASPSAQAPEGAASQTPGLDNGRLADGVAHALCGTGHPPLRGITVTAHARVITLSGQVSTYYLKQLAQAAALRVEGVDQIQNNIEVRSPPLSLRAAPRDVGQGAFLKRCHDEDQSDERTDE